MKKDVSSKDTANLDSEFTESSEDREARLSAGAFCALSKLTESLKKIDNADVLEYADSYQKVESELFGDEKFWKLYSNHKHAQVISSAADENQSIFFVIFNFFQFFFNSIKKF